VKKKIQIPQKIPPWLKYIFAIIPIVWIFWTINFHEMFRVFHSIAWWTIPSMVAGILLSMLLQGLRWWMLLRAFIPHIKFSRVINVHFIGIFYSIILPTNAAHEVVRAVLLSKENDYGITWGSTVVSRILGLLALAILSLFGIFLISKGVLPRGFYVSVLSIFIFLAIVFYLSFSKKITSPVRSISTKILPAKLQKIIEDIRQGIYMYRNKKKELFSVFLLTVFIQILLVGITSLLIAGITGKYFLPECFAYIPLIEIVSISIPLTPSGLGVREFLTKMMFNHIGISNEQLGVYIVICFMAILLKLVGAIPVLGGFLKNAQNKNPR
jgi:uncharacterized protein (TIRG00374 family)